MARRYFQLITPTYLARKTWFAKFEEIFPLEYREYLKKHQTAVRLQIRARLLDDIDYFISDHMDYELDMLKEGYLPDVIKVFRVRMTRKLRQAIWEASDGYIDIRPKTVKKIKPSSKKKETTAMVTTKDRRKFQRYDTILQQYIGKEKDFDAVLFLKRSFKRKEVQLKLMLDLQEYAQNLLVPFFEKEASLTSLFTVLCSLSSEDPRACLKIRLSGKSRKDYTILLN